MSETLENAGGTAGRLFVVAAPSGAGKTSLVRALIERCPDVEVTVSHTTRPQRPGERDGVNYFFVSPREFKDMQARDAFVESATVFGNFYGTSYAEIDRVTASGRHVILEIDWQGARQIRATRPAALSIFILPPSLDTLRERLSARAQDDETTIDRRMAEAISEMSHYREFDYVVVNDDFGVALDQLDAIVHRRGDPHALDSARGELEPLIADLLPPTLP
ncbi:MAG: guanylate kinase [Gammaproteobacteria bacterium]|nr:guanylate kinase [Gammaproteobacteria bacterium]